MKQPDDWRYAEAKKAGKKYFIRARLLPNDIGLRRAFSTLFVIKWSFQHGPEGLPLEESLVSDIESFESLLIQGAEDAGIAIKASCITGDGQRTWEYYTRDAEHFLTKINKTFAGQRRFPIELESMPDPDWHSLRKLNARLERSYLE